MARSLFLPCNIPLRNWHHYLLAVMCNQRISRRIFGVITRLLPLPLLDHSVNHGNGPSVFRSQGELAHWSGSLLPEPGHSPVYAQIYIYDPHIAVTHWMASGNTGSGLHLDTVEVLEGILQQNHQYTPLYLHAHEVLTQFPDTPDVAVCFRVAPGTDHQCYNLPTADEVAVILPTNVSTTEHHDSDIIL